MAEDFRTQLINDLKNAYRKWKSATYFDSFLITEANKLAFFELEENIRENDEFFEKFTDELLDVEKREELFKKLYSEVNVRCYPKDNSKSGTDAGRPISNFPKKQAVEKVLYMIDLTEKAHILGALWTMKFGTIIDKKLSSHCFGNRIRETLNKKEDSDKGAVPYLYYPYFKKYESWRDEGTNVLEKLLDMKLNAVMITLDIKNYFYNCRVNFEKLKSAIKEDIVDKNEQQEIDNYDFLHQFVEGIFRKYSQLFRLDNIEGEPVDKNPFIPIGFLPSYVISNWYLSKFDSIVKKKINPQYYGRYVDDILMVFSVNDDAFKSKTETEIFSNLMGNFEEIFLEESSLANSDPANNKKLYKIKGDHLHGTSHPLVIENSKIKVFYFAYLHSRVLIETFKSTILRQSSAFLYLHENDEDILANNDSDIWKIHYSDTPNKLRSVEEMIVDKFKLSKWLSFLVNFSGSLTKQEMIKINKTLFDTLSGSGYLQNFNLWEKYLLFFFKHANYESISRFCKGLINEVNSISEDTELINNFGLENKNDIDLLKRTLLSIFSAILQKVFSLRNDAKVKDLIEIIKEDIENMLPSTSINFFKDNFRESHLQSYMFNTQIVSYPLSDYKKQVINDKDYDALNSDRNFFYTSNSDVKHLLYFPRFIHFHEIQMYTLGYPHQAKDINAKKENYQKVWDNFWKINYGSNEHKTVNKSIQVEEIEKINNIDTIKMCVDKSVDKKEFTIGIANVNVDVMAFENALKGNSSFAISSRNKAADIINAAIKENVDLLVMPECYIHYGWIDKMIRIAKSHQMGMVFGLEHIVESDTNVYNYVVTLLPFTTNGFKNCAVEIRLKNHYSPKEKKYIKGYFQSVPVQEKEKNYTMYNWKGLSFAPYCCFEIASVEDRSLFKSKVDAIVVVEWNTDVEYFSNIIESMSRDLHCYCVQVNYSQYGDSRIVQPAQSYLKNIVRTKGGSNDYLIVEKINIGELRDFQIKDYELQEMHGKYKPTPPGFDPKEVKKR